MPARNRHFNQIGTHIIGSMPQFVAFADKFQNFNRSSKKRDKALYALWNRHILYNQKILSKFAINFEWYYQHVQQSDQQPYHLWNEQCDQQKPLLNLVLRELRTKHCCDVKYMQGIFSELDSKHKKYATTEFFGNSQGVTTSLAVYAYVLFKRFLAKFQCEEKHLGQEQIAERMRHWFENIPTRVIQTNLEYVSEHAITFTNQIGVQNVVFAMCVFQAHTMLEELIYNLTASLRGCVIFRQRIEEAKEAGCNFLLFELAFLDKMDWRLRVGSEEYIEYVRDLTCPKFPDIDIDCIEFDESRDKASAMLKMLQEASEVPDQKLCERLQSVQDESTSVDHGWIRDWINQVQASKRIALHLDRGLAICAPSYWETEKAKADAEAARKQSEPKSPW